MRRRFLGAGVSVLLCSGITSGCVASDDAPEAIVAHLPASADHHLHIRSQAASEHLDAMAVALGERAAGDGEPNTPLGAADAIRALDVAGVEAGVVLSNAYMFSMPQLPAVDEAAKVRAENEYVATQVALYPDRLVGLCSVNPLRPFALAEIETCGTDDRIVGLKLHLTNSGVDLRDDADVEALAKVFERADAVGLAIVIHMRTGAEDYGAVDAETFIERVFSRTSQVHVQIAHMAGWGGYDDRTDEALGAFAAAIQNGTLDGARVSFGLGAVVFQPEAAGADTALARTVRDNNAKLADRVRALGIERVVYATDWPSWPPVLDVSTGIVRNIELVRASLPMTSSELDQVFANVSPIFAGRPQTPS